MTPTKLYTPAELRFIVTEFTYACGYQQCTFWCKTDVPCHLTAHVADQRPIIRRIPYEKRGAQFVLSSVTCFVEINLIEQIESGDTLDHTFVIPFPEYDNTYYWYLTGTMNGTPCLSISQIFWHSCAPIVPQVTCHSDHQGTFASMPDYCMVYGRWFKPPTNQRTYQWHMRYRKYPDPYWANIQDFWLLHCNAAKLPDSILAHDQVVLPTAVPDLTEFDVYFSIPNVHLLADTTYAYALRCSKPSGADTSWRTSWERGINETCPSTGYSYWTAFWGQTLLPSMQCGNITFIWNPATVTLPFYELIAHPE